MGMRVSSSPSSSTSMPIAEAGGGAAKWQQRQEDFKALSSAMQSGDVNAAKAAYASLTSGMSNLASHPNSPLAQLGKALDSGDMSAASAAFAKVGAHHPRLASGSGTPAPAPAPAPATASTGNNLNVVA